MENNETLIKESVKERLLLAGIHEIELHGFNDFSLRRVASACNLSCAAPYRHFKGKEELLEEILKYIDSRWDLMRQEVISAYENDIKKQLIEVAIQYVRFLIVTPSYFSIMFHKRKRGEILSANKSISELVYSYGESNGWKKEDSEAFLYSISALIYGTVVLLRGKIMEPQEALDYFRRKIEQELEK